MAGFLGTVWWSILMAGGGFAAGVFMANKVKSLLARK